MKWTKEKPTKPGYYWFKTKYSTGIIVYVNKGCNFNEVINITKNINNEELFVKCFDGTIFNMANLDGKWSSKPIILPEKESETKFEIYDKVLVRDFEHQPWLPSIFCGYTNEEEFPYRASDLYNYKMCIPYKGNEHLIGKKG